MISALSMVAVAQSVESRIVIPVVVGSNPIRHPKSLEWPNVEVASESQINRA